MVAWPQSGAMAEWEKGLPLVRTGSRVVVARSLNRRSRTYGRRLNKPSRGARGDVPSLGMLGQRDGACSHLCSAALNRRENGGFVLESHPCLEALRLEHAADSAAVPFPRELEQRRHVGARTGRFAQGGRDLRRRRRPRPAGCRRRRRRRR